MAVTSTVGIDGATIYAVKHTSGACRHGAVPPPEPGDLTNGETCGGTSNEFCLSNQGENCGFLNDGFVCLGKVENDGCQVFADGGRVCGGSAPTPPAPDNGTPGQVATPDAPVAVTVNTTTTTNYFNSTTVAASARPPGASGDNPYDGEDDGDGAGGGGSSGGEEGECPEGATCDGSLPDAGEFGEVCTVQECTQAFFNRVKAAPLFAGLLGVGAAIPAGACPSWNVEVFDDEFSLSAPMCDVWENILDWLVELLLWVPLKLLEMFLDGLALFFEAIPVPEFMENLGNYASALDPAIGYFVAPLQLGTGLGFIVLAYILRFAIRRLPVIG